VRTRKTRRELGASEDVSLVCSAKQGDMVAFDELTKRYSPMIFRIAMRIAGSREDAEDVVQDAFLKAFLHLQGFEERSRFSTWLTRIAVNEALARLRRSRRGPTVSIDDRTDDSMSLGDRIADWKPNPEQHYNTFQLRKLLHEALFSLPDRQKVVFLLRDVEGLCITDTAEMLGLSVPNVKTRLLRAHLKLRRSLKPHIEHGSSGVRPVLTPRKIHNEVAAGNAT
jgi:RNA polymerase sigma-70 factor (ECF subfamily)